MSNDLYLHVVKQDLATVENLKKGFAAFSDSKYFDPAVSIEEVERNQILIGKMPHYWIASMEAPVANEIMEMVGEDFPTLSTMLRDRILEALRKDRVRFKQVRSESTGLNAFFDLYLNFQCFTYVW